MRTAARIAIRIVMTALLVGGIACRAVESPTGPGSGSPGPGPGNPAPDPGDPNPGDPDPGPGPSSNQAPTAVAGPDQTIPDSDGNGAEVVTLDGTSSSDTDGSVTNYAWTTGGTPLAFGPTASVPFQVGTFTIQLTVTDDQGATSTDDVVITVLAAGANQPPTADAGPDQALTDADANGTEAVTLNGAGSSDIDGAIVTYVWSEGFSQIATGAVANLSLAVGTHTIRLTVTDDGGATDTDDVVITILAAGANQPPFANAGPDQTTTDADDSGTENVTLDGSGSFDLDGTIMSYVWTEGANPIGTGTNPTLPFSVGSHNVTLTVTDDRGGQDTDDVLVTVQSGGPNQPPTADAGPDIDITDTDGSGDELVMLDGTGSSDPDGTVVSRVWTNGAELLGSGPQPLVTFVVGSHTVTLTVTDNDGATDVDTVVVTIRP